MPRRHLVRAGILFALLLTLSCGEQNPTHPALPTELIAKPFSENFETSPQRESRELLIDGRPTDIEWNGTGDATFLLARGDGGTFYVLMRTLWTFDARTNEIRGLYFMMEWPDREESRLETPLITNLDTGNADGITNFDCNTDNRIISPGSWAHSDLHEDEVFVELYSDSLGDYPADGWRWGAGTTDPAVPVNPTEFVGAGLDETDGAAEHPLGGSVEDLYSTGGGWSMDAGLPPNIPNANPGSAVPIFIAGKGSRDVRLNRSKPTAYMIWKKVAKVLAPCDTLDPIRVDDASLRDKTWHPGDYQPSVVIQLPTDSQSDVVARGGWLNGKWALEMRRDLVTRPPDVNGNQQPPRPDDVQLQEGRHYMIRFTFYNASKTLYSQTELLPLYIVPRH